MLAIIGIFVYGSALQPLGLYENNIKKDECGSEGCLP